MAWINCRGVVKIVKARLTRTPPCHHAQCNAAFRAVAAATHTKLLAHPAAHNASSPFVSNIWMVRTGTVQANGASGSTVEEFAAMPQWNVNSLRSARHRCAPVVGDTVRFDHYRSAQVSNAIDERPLVAALTSKVVHALPVATDAQHTK